MTDTPSTREAFDAFRDIREHDIETFNHVWRVFANAMEAAICCEIEPGDRHDVWDELAEANDVWGTTLDVDRPSDSLYSLMTDIEAVLVD
jgi:hypothetical protein